MEWEGEVGQAGLGWQVRRARLNGQVGRVGQNNHHLRAMHVKQVELAKQVRWARLSGQVKHASLSWVTSEKEGGLEQSTGELEQ